MAIKPGSLTGVLLLFRYTYGKPVLGSVKAEVCRKKGYRYYWLLDREITSDICIKYEMTVSKLDLTAALGHPVGSVRNCSLPGSLCRTAMHLHLI